MRTPTIALLALLASLTATACGDSTPTLPGFIAVTPNLDGVVSILDQCQPASFNAVLGPGTCTGQGATTVAEFSAELAATGTVAAWQFDPATLTLMPGRSITATNHGGEVHTFTKVAQFGGGIIPALNTASGNPTEAPECKGITNADRIAPGGTFKTDVGTRVGTHLYQCCIHPWMRETVAVINP
jgi:plastocyanin